MSSYYERYRKSGISEDQALALLRQRQLPESEISKLRDRLQKMAGRPALSSGSSNATRPANTERGKAESEQEEGLRSSPGFVLDSADLEIYGAEIFAQPNLSFQPEAQIATPLNYILGPDDEILINVYGLSEANYQLTVSKDGIITIPGAGNIAVSGLSVENARQKITSRLGATIYTAIRSGQTKVDLSLGKLRSIRVTVIGQARKPGVFQVSSASTVFNVLYNAGGPNRNGSYRNIAVVRNGQVKQSIDLYEFLSGGSLSANIRLQENDVIRIPFYETRIRLKGAFKRPGLFELKEEETLRNIIAYAGGFSDSAYRGSLSVAQINEKQRQIRTLTGAEINSFRPGSGDEVEATKVQNRFSNRLVVEGGFNRPGNYEFTPGMTLRQLIAQADGLRPEAYADRISVSRLNPDQSITLVSFSYSQIQQTEAGNFVMQNEDRVSVPVVFDLRDNPYVQVLGQVRRPGTYSYREGATLQDLVTQAGGFTEAATAKNIEIGRRINNSDSGRNSLQIAEVISVDQEKNLAKTTRQIILKPFDILIVRNNPGYFEQKLVRIEGEVAYTGLYTIANREERISDLIRRTGGFTALADPKSVSLRRKNNLASDSLKLKAVGKQLNSLKKNNANLDLNDVVDSLSTNQYDQVAINLEEILQRPKSTIDIILQDGDVINVPKRDQAVKVRGEVLLPTQVAFESGKTLKYYIHRAGGFTSKALRRQTFAISANGNGKTVSHFFFFRFYPKVEAGDDIYVPQRPDRSNAGLSATTVVGLASAVASLAGVVIAIVNISRN